MAKGYAILYMGLFSFMAQASDDSSSSASLLPLLKEERPETNLALKEEGALNPSPVLSYKDSQNFLDALERAADVMTLCLESLMDDAKKLKNNLGINEREGTHQSYLSTLQWLHFFVENFHTLHKKFLDVQSNEYVWKETLTNSEKNREIRFQSLSSFYQEIQAVSMNSLSLATGGLSTLEELNGKMRKYQSRIQKKKKTDQREGEGPTSHFLDQSAIGEEEIFFIE